MYHPFSQFIIKVQGNNLAKRFDKKPNSCCKICLEFCALQNSFKFRLNNHFTVIEFMIDLSN